jgi:hypothetical protein
MSKKKKDKRPDVITVMCDYCADGLWFNGSAIDAEMLYTDFGFEKKDLKKFTKRIEKWQDMYEGFNLYTSKEDSDEEYTTKEFKEFAKLGKKIFRHLKEINLKRQLNYIIEYYDEETGKRFY